MDETTRKRGHVRTRFNKELKYYAYPNDIRQYSYYLNGEFILNEQGEKKLKERYPGFNIEEKLEVIRHKLLNKLRRNK